MFMIKIIEYFHYSFLLLAAEELTITFMGGLITSKWLASPI